MQRSGLRKIATAISVSPWKQTKGRTARAYLSLLSLYVSLPRRGIAWQSSSLRLYFVTSRFRERAIDPLGLDARASRRALRDAFSLCLLSSSGGGGGGGSATAADGTPSVTDRPSPPPSSSPPPLPPPPPVAAPPAPSLPPPPPPARFPAAAAAAAAAASPVAAATFSSSFGAAVTTASRRGSPRSRPILRLVLLLRWPDRGPVHRNGSCARCRRLSRCCTCYSARGGRPPSFTSQCHMVSRWPIVCWSSLYWKTPLEWVAFLRSRADCRVSQHGVFSQRRNSDDALVLIVRGKLDRDILAKII